MFDWLIDRLGDVVVGVISGLIVHWLTTRTEKKMPPKA